LEAYIVVINRAIDLITEKKEITGETDKDGENKDGQN